MIEVSKEDFQFDTDDESLEYFREIIEHMMLSFGISPKECKERINKSWSHVNAVIGDDIMYHELPKYWSHHFYFGKESFWWLASEKRKEMGLKDLKPLPL